MSEEIPQADCWERSSLLRKYKLHVRAYRDSIEKLAVLADKVTRDEWHAAFVLSFAITVALLTHFPPHPVSDDERTRLAAENQSLKIENKNTAINVQRLSTQLSQMEEKAQQITDLMNSAD